MYTPTRGGGAKNLHNACILDSNAQIVKRIGEETRTRGFSTRTTTGVCQYKYLLASANWLTPKRNGSLCKPDGRTNKKRPQDQNANNTKTDKTEHNDVAYYLNGKTQNKRADVDSMSYSADRLRRELLASSDPNTVFSSL